jgi:chromosome segregation ATPase
MTPHAATPTPLLTITYRELLKYPEQKLVQLFNEYLQVALKGADEADRETAKQILLMMEGAPELKEKINQIMQEIQDKLEEKNKRFESQLLESRGKKSETNSRLLQLKEQYRVAQDKKAEKENIQKQITQKLENVRQQIREAETSEKMQWMKRAEQSAQTLEKMEIAGRDAKTSWETVRQNYLDACRQYQPKNDTDAPPATTIRETKPGKE